MCFWSHPHIPFAWHHIRLKCVILREALGMNECTESETRASLGLGPFVGFLHSCKSSWTSSEKQFWEWGSSCFQSAGLSQKPNEGTLSLSPIKEILWCTQKEKPILLGSLSTLFCPQFLSSMHLLTYLTSYTKQFYLYWTSVTEQEPLGTFRMNEKPQMRNSLGLWNRMCEPSHEGPHTLHPIVLFPEQARHRDMLYNTGNIASILQ